MKEKGESHLFPSKNAQRCERVEARCRYILALMAQGKSDEEILRADQAVTRYDLMRAARLALGALERRRRANFEAAKTLSHYPRAFEKWCPSEEQRILDLFARGKTLREIASLVERKPSAVKERLLRLGGFSL